MANIDDSPSASEAAAGCMWMTGVLVVLSFVIMELIAYWNMGHFV